MNTLFISTLNHNPGDEFIRWGQQHLLRQAGIQGAAYVMHKHDPRTLFSSFTPGSTPHRLIAPLLYRAYASKHREPDALAAADLVVFAGTPFIWRQNTRLLPSTSANAEWVGPTWGRLFTEFRSKIVLNLAAGTSLNLGQNIDRITGDRTLAAFLTAAVRRAELTTARDRLTAFILGQLGHGVPVLACTSLWASAGAGLTAGPPEYVAVNVMAHGVHTARGKRTHAVLWRDTIAEVVAWLSRRHPVRFICHSRSEYDLAREWFPAHDVFFSADARELLRAYGQSLYTIANRVHGAAGAASFGRPALGIGGDSRVDLLREFGLPVAVVAESTSESIIAQCNDIETRYDETVEGLSSLSSQSKAEYLRLIRSAIP